MPCSKFKSIKVIYKKQFLAFKIGTYWFTWPY